MYKIVLLMFFVCCRLHGETLSVKDCVAEAQANSNKLESARSQILLAKAIKNQQLSPLLPQIEVEGRYELKNKGQDYSVFTEFGSAFSTKTIGLTAQMLLFDFFATWNKYLASKCEIIISEKAHEQMLLNLVEEVKIAFFKVLENENSVKVIEDAAARLEQQLKSVQNLFEHAAATKADILAVKVRLIEEKKTLLHAKAETLQSKMALNTLLGRDIFSPLQLAEPAINSYPQYIPEILQKQALANRCDVLMLREKIRSFNYLLKSAREAYAPNFFVFGGYQYLDDAPPSKADANWFSGGIGMRFSLYDGGNKRAETQKIKAQMQMAKADLANLEKTVLMEVNQYDLKCKEILENISIDDDAIQLAEENFHSLSERYGQGLESIDSLLKAEHALIQAQMNKNKTIYMYHVSYAHLEAVLSGTTG